MDFVSNPNLQAIYIGHEWKGSHNPILRGLTITMVINYLQTGMMLQVTLGTRVKAGQLMVNG